MEQELINWILGGFCALLGWLLRTMWEAVKDLQTADKSMAEKVASIEVLVAGHYVTREEFSGVMTRVESKLDKISTKLDSKADK